MALAFVMCGCEEYNSHGPKMPFTITKGSIRTTETSDYIATEVCIDLMGIVKGELQFGNLSQSKRRTNP